MYFILLVMILSTVLNGNCIELNQPALMVVKPGESFSIGCKITGYSASGGGCTNWIRQTTGKALEWIGWFCSSGDTGTSDTMKNKVSFTAETSSNTVFLQGQNFQTEDTAVYYCARIHSATNCLGTCAIILVFSPCRLFVNTQT